MGSQIIDLGPSVTHLAVMIKREGVNPVSVRTEVEYDNGERDLFVYSTRDVRALPHIRSIFGVPRGVVRSAFQDICVEPVPVPKVTV